MRSHALLSGLLLAGSIFAVPAFAQSGPPSLAYIQPVPPPTVTTVQSLLRQAGVYNGAVDGVWGPDSATALQRFQQSHQLQVTGQLNQPTVTTLGLDPNTLMVGSAAPPPAAPPPPAALQSASVRAIQGRLQTLGFYNGPVDGVWGEATQVAIQRLQRGHALQPNGQLDAPTVTAMGLAPDALAYR